MRRSPLSPRRLILPVERLSRWPSSPGSSISRPPTTNATGYSNLAFPAKSWPVIAPPRNRPIEKASRKIPRTRACRVNFGLMLAPRQQALGSDDPAPTVLTAAEVHYNLASVMEQQGNKEQARAEYRKALDLDPNMSDAQVRVGCNEVVFDSVNLVVGRVFKPRNTR